MLDRNKNKKKVSFLIRDISFILHRKQRQSGIAFSSQIKQAVMDQGSPRLD